MPTKTPAGLALLLVALVSCAATDNGDDDFGAYVGSDRSLAEILASGSDDTATPEAHSLLDRELFPTTLEGERRAGLEVNLRAALLEHMAAPDDEERLIWVGRRLGYLGRYRDAVQVYSRGIELHPASYRLRRHRGHRYVSLRDFERAEADLAEAARLANGVPDEIEPDGAPNAFGIPTSSDQSNIWYHLGLARYLLRDFEGAARACRECMTFAPTDDMRVATAYWLSMTLQRLGRADAAMRVLRPISAETVVLENTAYHALILFFKGELTEDEVLAGVEPDTVQYPTRAYGLGNQRLWNGDREGARAIFQRIVDGEVWPAFGHIAAEAELAEMKP